MTSSTVIIRATHLPPFKGIYFSLKTKKQSLFSYSYEFILDTIIYNCVADPKLQK